MSTRFSRRAPTILLLLLFAGCGTTRGADEDRPLNGVTRQNGAVVITGQDLEDGRGSVLSALQGKVPSLRIRRIRNSCPQISLRNAVSFGAVVNPHVYVDGTRATDTCILESLRTEDIERVEVYPMGVTTRPGYGRHAHGLILLFMRGAGGQ